MKTKKQKILENKKEQTEGWLTGWLLVLCVTMICNNGFPIVIGHANKPLLYLTRMGQKNSQILTSVTITVVQKNRWQIGRKGKKRGKEEKKGEIIRVNSVLN